MRHRATRLPRLPPSLPCLLYDFLDYISFLAATALQFVRVQARGKHLVLVQAEDRVALRPALKAPFQHLALIRRQLRAS